MDVIPHSSEPSDSQILQKMQQVGIIIYTPYSHLYEDKD
jgi:Mn-dependent DtxR family transcriptional regulator